MISRSLRNASRCSVTVEYRGGRALNGLGLLLSTDPNQTPNAIDMFCSSEAVGDKIHCQEGNNPDLQLRSLNSY